MNRSDHAHSGAIMAMQILRSLGMSAEDISVVISAIGNHDEKTGTAVNAVSAAIILADKTDVRRNRVRNKKSQVLIFTTESILVYFQQNLQRTLRKRNTSEFRIR